MEDESSIHDSNKMAVERSMGLFYADDILIGWQDLEWLQGSLNVLIRIFRRVSLMGNVANSNTMTFQLGEIITGMS